MPGRHSAYVNKQRKGFANTPSFLGFSWGLIGSIIIQRGVTFESFAQTNAHHAARYLGLSSRFPVCQSHDKLTQRWTDKRRRRSR